MMTRLYVDFQLEAADAASLKVTKMGVSVISGAISSAPCMLSSLPALTNLVRAFSNLKNAGGMSKSRGRENWHGSCEEKAQGCDAGGRGGGGGGGA